MCEELTVEFFKVGILFQHSPGVTDENHEKSIPISLNFPHDEIMKKLSN
jgi:hypothetical protein